MTAPTPPLRWLPISGLPRSFKSRIAERVARSRDPLARLRAGRIGAIEDDLFLLTETRVEHVVKIVLFKGIGEGRAAQSLRVWMSRSSVDDPVPPTP